jgi:hypothetical protein
VRGASIPAKDEQPDLIGKISLLRPKPSKSSLGSRIAEGLKFFDLSSNSSWRGITRRILTARTSIGARCQLSKSFMLKDFLFGGLGGTGAFQSYQGFR